MKRIQDDYAVSALPAAPALSGPVGFFTGGTPGVSLPTRVRAWWLNMIQEELIALLVARSLPIDGTKTLRHALSGLLVDVITYDASDTFTMPFDGWVDVELVGGGGSGGATTATGAGQVAAASGGGPGGYCRRNRIFLTKGTVVSVTIGLGGAAPAAGAAGNPGTASSFGTYCSASGGEGGTVGNAGAPSGLPYGGARGGIGSGGDINARAASAGPALYTNPALASEGGFGPWGGGGTGVAGSGNGGAATGAGGGGGGGAQSVPSSGPAIGGAGSKGKVIVRVYL